MGKRPATTGGNGNFTRYHVPSLARALKVMEFLASRPEGVGVSQIAQGLKIPTNSAFRIATTLADYGYVWREEPSATYRLSPKFLKLGYAAADTTSLVERSVDVLRDLRDATGETALLAVRSAAGGVVVEQMPALHPIKVIVQIGHPLVMHTAAPGKAMLAFLSAAERAAALDRLTFTRFTQHTITSRADFEAELAEVARLGYAVDRGEEDLDIYCIAAPVRDHRGEPVAAIWVTGPTTRLDDRHAAAVGRLVVEQAARISKRFGHD